MTANEFGSQLAGLENSLVRFAYRFNLKKADTQDLVQETFLKALSGKELYVENEKFKTWTFTIMKNIFFDNYRRSAVKKFVNYSTYESIFETSTEPAGTEDPDASYAALEINEIIDQLKEPLRIPFKMYVNGFKYIEIAARLNLKIGTVKNRIFMSRKQLMYICNNQYK